MTGADDAERFQFGLEVIIAGLEAVSRAAKGGQPGAHNEERD
jgi:hypothetical protein